VTKLDNYSWPDPLELIDMEEAVKERKTKAMIGDREFRIRYEDKYFVVSPVEGFSPYGQFDYEHTFDEITLK